MTLNDLQRDVYLCPTTPIACQLVGFQYLPKEPLRQLCVLSDGDTRIELVLAAAATVAPGLAPGDALEAVIGLRIGQGWGRVEVLALQRSVRRHEPSHAAALPRQGKPRIRF